MTVASARITKDGIWLQGSSARSPRPVPGLFLDRDGVLVEDVNYLRRPEDIRTMPGAASLLRWANEKHIPVAVVTNQSGIARDLFSWDQFESVHNEIVKQLKLQGAEIDLTLACPFHPDYTKDWNETHGYWRKPGPGLLREAADLLNLDLKKSWMVGDRESDVIAAVAAGLAGAIQVSIEDETDQCAATDSCGGNTLVIRAFKGLPEVLEFLNSRF